MLLAMRQSVARFAVLLSLCAGCGSGVDAAPTGPLGERDAAPGDLLDATGAKDSALKPPESGPPSPGDAGDPGDAGALPAPASADATAALSPRQKLLAFLASTSGKKTLSGEHNRESSQGDFISAMRTVTGHSPALWGGDFLFEASEIQNRPNVIQRMVDGWHAGVLPSLMYHACPPTQGESCDWDGGVLSALTDAQWSDLTTDGGMLNQTWKSRLDAIAPYFQTLKDAGVATLFRPHHEMNQGVFWWAGRPGLGGTAKLFQITHDYLVNVKGLDNIVWVWSVQDIWNSQDNAWDFDKYDPGDGYWDVMSLDFYDGAGYTTDKYQAMLARAGGKPIAIGECQVLPTPAEVAAQPQWAYFMGWAELIQQNDSNAQITATYTAPTVLTADTMPGW